MLNLPVSTMICRLDFMCLVGIKVYNEMHCVDCFLSVRAVDQS